MRSVKFGAVVLSAGLLLAACGDDGDSSSSATTAAGGSTATTAAADVDCTKADSFCIGLVTDTGKVDDKSFNQAAWDGAQAGATAVGGHAEYLISPSASDYEPNIKNFVDKKYKVIITVGFLLGDATIAAAKANPDVHFIGVDQFQGEEVANLTGLIFNEDKAGFMAGALAGLLTKTNKVGAVLGTDTVPPVVAFKTGWENGAKYTNPNVEVKSIYHPAGDTAFNDPDFGATNAKQLLDQGFDVIFGAGGNTGNGALTEIAKKAGAYCVGVDVDQWDGLPAAQPCLVTSAMKNLAGGTTDIIKAIKDGSVKGGNFFGTTAIAPYHDFDAKIPAEVKAKVAEIVEGVTSGKIPTGYTPG